MGFGQVDRLDEGRTSSRGGRSHSCTITPIRSELHGTITSNCLWATAAQFSNDVSEIDYAVFRLPRKLYKKCGDIRKS